MWDASLSQSSGSSWTMHRLSIQMYRTPSFCTTSKLSWKVLGRAVTGIPRKSNSRFPLVSFKISAVPQQWLRVQYSVGASTSRESSRWTVLASSTLSRQMRRDGSHPEAVGLLHSSWLRRQFWSWVAAKCRDSLEFVAGGKSPTRSSFSTSGYRSAPARRGAETPPSDSGGDRGDCTFRGNEFEERNVVGPVVYYLVHIGGECSCP